MCRVGPNQTCLQAVLLDGLRLFELPRLRDHATAQATAHATVQATVHATVQATAQPQHTMQESSPPFGRGLASSPFGLGTASLHTPPILPRAEAVQLAEMLVAMLASAQQVRRPLSNSHRTRAR